MAPNFLAASDKEIGGPQGPSENWVTTETSDLFLGKDWPSFFQSGREREKFGLVSIHLL